MQVCYYSSDAYRKAEDSAVAVGVWFGTYEVSRP